MQLWSTTAPATINGAQFWTTLEPPGNTAASATATVSVSVGRQPLGARPPLVEWVAVTTPPLADALQPLPEAETNEMPSGRLSVTVICPSHCWSVGLQTVIS